MKCVYALVHGRVQGVGFRAATLRTARSLNLIGWVRNRADDSVEVTAKGEDEALRRFEEFLRRGPPSAHVRGVDISWEPVSDSLGELNGFEIR